MVHMRIIVPSYQTEHVLDLLENLEEMPRAYLVSSVTLSGGAEEGGGNVSSPCDLADAAMVQSVFGGTVAEVTVLFADLRGFTSFSERSSPEQVVEMLNRYFGLAVPAIVSNGFPENNPNGV